MTGPERSPLPATANTCIIVVSASRPDVLATLLASFREDVIVDRRAKERRRGQRRNGRLAEEMPGRRRRERRAAPSATWEIHGFILAPTTTGAPPAGG